MIKLKPSVQALLLIVGLLLCIVAAVIFFLKTDQIRPNASQIDKTKSKSSSTVTQSVVSQAGHANSLSSSEQVKATVAVSGETEPLQKSAGEGDLEDTPSVYHAGMKITASQIGIWLADAKLPETELLKRLHEAFSSGGENADVKAEALTHWLNLQSEDNEADILALLKTPAIDDTTGILILRDSLSRSEAMQAKVALALLGSNSDFLKKQASEQLVAITHQDLGKKPEDWAAYLQSRFKPKDAQE